MTMSRKGSANTERHTSKRAALRRLRRVRNARRVLALLLVLTGLSLIPASPAAAVAPTVTKVSPSSGPLVGGQIVTITGTGFDSIATTGAVKFGTVAATDYAVMSDKQLVATVPNAAAGGDAVIEVTNTSSEASTNGAKYKYVAPLVKKVEPGWAKEDASSFVTITGEGLLGTVVADVEFGGNAVLSVWVISDKAIVVETAIDDDNGTAGDTSDDTVVDNGVTDVVVTRNSVASATGDDSKFLFTPGKPTITQLEDGSSGVVSGTGTGGVDAGDTLTIVGTQLWGVSQVNFGKSKVTGDDITLTSATEITVKVPKQSNGPVDVTVENAAGESLTNLKTVFSYYSTDAPKITKVYPEVVDKTDTTGGGTLLLTGKGLTGVDENDITLTCDAGSDAAVTSATAVSDTSLVMVMFDNGGTAATCTIAIDNPQDNTKTSETYTIRYV